MMFIRCFKNVQFNFKMPILCYFFLGCDHVLQIERKNIIFTGTFLHTNTNLTIIKKNRGFCHASNSHNKVLNTLYSISIIIKILLITSLQRTKLKCHTLIGLNMTRDCKIYFLMFDRLDLRCAIWPKLCVIISFLHHYKNYAFLKRFKCT